MDMLITMALAMVMCLLIKLGMVLFDWNIGTGSAVMLAIIFFLVSGIIAAMVTGHYEDKKRKLVK